MDKHGGQIVEYIIRKNGHNISDVAKTLGINRRTLYNWFKTKHLKPGIIYRIGLSIRHDFSQQFPEFFTSQDFAKIYSPKSASYVAKIPETNLDESQWKDKYFSLLRLYNGIITKELSTYYVHPEVESFDHSSKADKILLSDVSFN